MSWVLFRDPLWGAHRNMLRKLSCFPFVSGPHPTCWKQQPRPSRMELPEGGSQVEEEGGQGAGRVGVEDTQKSQSLLRGSLCAEPTSGGNNCRIPSPAAHLLLMGTCQRGLPLENFVALLLSGVWLFRAAQLWLVYIIKLETRDLRKLMVHALLSHLLTRKLRSRGGKPPTYPGSQ